MENNRKAITIIIAAILLAGFFMPWIKVFGSFSAWDMVFGTLGDMLNSKVRYLAVIIPVSSVVIIFSAVFNNEEYPLPKLLLFTLPLVTFLVLGLIIFDKIGGSQLFRNSDIVNSLLKVFGIGFWLTLIASIVLPSTIQNSIPKQPAIPVVRYSTQSKTGLVVIIISIVVVIISTQEQLFIKKENYRVDPGAMGLPDAYNIMGPTYDTRTYVDSTKKNMFLYFGLFGLVVGGLLFAFGRSVKESLTSTTQIAGAETGLPIGIAENQRAIQIPFNVSFSQIGLWMNVNSRKAFDVSKIAFKKHKKAILLSVAGLILCVTIYNLFIKANPLKEGAIIANLRCECRQKNSTQLIKVYQDFINSFKSADFRLRQDAKNKLQHLLNPINAANAECEASVQQKYDELHTKYVSRYEDLGKFETAANTAPENCNLDSQTKQNSLYSDIESKIATIIDPEPDLDRIKTDLIGSTIPGWKFDFLSEIKEAVLSNTSRGADRIEYQIDLKLEGYKEHELHDAQIIAVYNRGDAGWYFTEVRMLYITYDNVIPADRWKQIAPLANCNWSATNDSKLYWKTSEYGGEYMSGPDVDQLSLPSNPVYFLKSREEHDVTVRFTYRPIN